MFQLVDTSIDIDAARKRLLNSKGGALVTFEGLVRDHNDGRAVLALEYQAYDRLATKEGVKILNEARAGFDILECSCIHRTGLLEIGEMAVWIGVVAAHREAALAACRFIIEEVKARLPIWKRERYANGECFWVNCVHEKRLPFAAVAESKPGAAPSADSVRCINKDAV